MNQRISGLLLIAVLLAWSLWLVGLLLSNLSPAQLQLQLATTALGLLVIQGLLLALLLPPLQAANPGYQSLSTAAWLTLVPLPIHSILWLMGALSPTFLGGLMLTMTAISAGAMIGASAIRALPLPRWHTLLTAALQLGLSLTLLPATRLLSGYLPT